MNLINLLIMSSYNYRKAIQVINFFAIKEGGEIDKMKVIKLIWLSDRFHLRQYGRPIIMDDYLAMKHGPIPSHTKDLLKENDDFLPHEEFDYRDTFITPANDDHIIGSKAVVDTNVFSESELSALEKIYKEFGQLPKFTLRDLSHKYPEWKRFKKALDQGLDSRFPMNYADFFKNPSEADSKLFNQNSDHLEYSQKISDDMYSLSDC